MAALALSASAAQAASLPDGRVYEQATPVDKDGGDAVGKVSQEKAALGGDAITFGSTFGIPGGVGAQALPLYLAKRGPGQEGWSTQGLLPPPSSGERARVIGWLPDFSASFSKAILLGNPRKEALLEQSTTGGAITEIAPYTAKAEYSFDGTSADGSVVLFEAEAKLPPKAGEPPIAAAVQGRPNLYAWDRSTGELHLAGTLNTEPQTKAALPNGSIAGSITYGYLQEQRAIATDGSVYFTAAGLGQLYLRLNPTKPQSPLNGQGECTDKALACTIHVSETEKANGKGVAGSDPAGPQPAVFQAATADGSEAFFTSPEMLTDDAKTGPEQPLAAIARDTIDGKAENVQGQFIPTHAIGVAVDGSHIYWADPSRGTIGRANLDGTQANDAFITPGPVEFEFEVELKGGGFEKKEETVESRPRYVAVDSEYVYWTNTGRSDKEGPVDGEGTIGRARLDGTEVNPEFIRGASDPQGIGANATHIYWVNAGRKADNRAIARAAIGGGTVEEEFFVIPNNSLVPSGLALDASHVYFSLNNDGNDFGEVSRIPLGGGSEEFVGIGKAGVRGLAVDGANLYWATQGEAAIGRIPLADFPKLGGCEATPNCERKFIEVEGKPNGLAASATHLLWAANGEAPTNPGNDLYRFDATAPAGARLSDLSVDDAAVNGAEVQGVLGASADGANLYFAANGVLAGGASAGGCQAVHAGRLYGSLSGKCSLYLLREGTIGYLARLDIGGGEVDSEVRNWVPTPLELFSTNSYELKTSFLADEGRALLFRSRSKLSAYENEGAQELYRYRTGDAAIRCVSCDPSGGAPGAPPSLGSVAFPHLAPAPLVAAVASRNFSADGRRAFFETTEALSPDDENDVLDVYEWEAPEAGSCSEASPEYSIVNEGCLFLISTGKSPYPSLFADASENGNDVFFFTREGLVGRDKDELQDVYDARVEGGLISQNEQPPVPCESIEACHGPGQQPPAESTPATPGFQGPGDPTPKHKAKKRQKKQKRHAKHRRAHPNRRAGR